MKKVLDAYSSKNDINIKQIVAYKDNVLEMEEYKDGFKKDDTMNVMSVTKSVTSLLIGIAIDQGLINNVEGVMHFFESTYRLINKYNQKNKVAKTYGTEDLLYSAEVHMIEIIGDYETITTTKLAKTLGITKGAVSQITHKLLKKSLIDKIPSVEKNNEVLISLTDRGRIVYSHHQNMHKKMMERIDAIICNLSEEGKAALVQIVQVIDESLDDL